MDTVEIILRFIGFSKEEMRQMPEKELYRKAFSAMHLVETIVSSLFGGDGDTPLPPSNLQNPYSEPDSTFMGI